MPKNKKCSEYGCLKRENIIDCQSINAIREYKEKNLSLKNTKRKGKL